MELGNITVLAAFLGGMVSFLSPCILPMLPVFSAMLAGSAVQENPGWRIYINAACFLIGFTLVFVMMGATASLLGQWFLDHQPQIRQIGALLITIMGLSLSGLIQVAPLKREYRPFLSRSFQGPFGAFLLGISFTVGWTPCIGPVLTSILLYAGGNTTAANGAWLLFIYAMGFSIPFFLLAVILRQYVSHVRMLYEWLPKIQRATGYMLIVIGMLIWFDWLQKGLGIFWPIL